MVLGRMGETHVEGYDGLVGPGLEFCAAVAYGRGISERKRGIVK